MGEFEISNPIFVENVNIFCLPNFKKKKILNHKLNILTQCFYFFLEFQSIAANSGLISITLQIDNSLPQYRIVMVLNNENEDND